MDENDNKQLLTEILKEHYKSRYSLVEEALEEINAYSKNPSKNAYKQVRINKTHYVFIFTIHIFVLDIK